MKQKPTQFPNHRMSEFPYYGSSMGKHRQFPGSALPHRFIVNGNLCNPQFLEMHKFPYRRNILKNSLTFPGCEFLRKLELIRKPKQSPEHESSKISKYGNNKGKTALFPWCGLWLKINWVRQPTQFPDMAN